MKNVKTDENSQKEMNFTEKASISFSYSESNYVCTSKRNNTSCLNDKKVLEHDFHDNYSNCMDKNSSEHEEILNQSNTKGKKGAH